MGAGAINPCKLTPGVHPDTVTQHSWDIAGRVPHHTTQTSAFQQRDPASFNLDFLLIEWIWRKGPFTSTRVIV